MDITKIRELILTEDIAGEKLTSYHESMVSQGYKAVGQLRNENTGISAHMYAEGKGRNQHHVVAYVKHGHVYKESNLMEGAPNYGEIKSKLLNESYYHDMSDLSGPIDPSSANAELLRKRMAAIGETVTNDDDVEPASLKNEVLDPKKASASDYIRDFIKSKSKTFSGDTKKQRIRRALGAYYGAKKEKEEDLQVLKQGDNNIQEGWLFGGRTPVIGHTRHTHQVQYELTSSSGKALRSAKRMNAHVVAPSNDVAVQHLANYLGHNNFRVTRIDHVHEPRTRIHKEELVVNEGYDNETLARYKKAAAKSAKEADARGDFRTGNKRFAGINRATKQQFKNDMKKYANKEEELEPKGHLLKEKTPKKKKMRKEEKIKISGRKDLIDTEPTLNTLTATR